MRINVNVQDQAIQELLGLLEDPTPALLSAGNGVRALLQDHYFQKNEDEPNRQGFPRSNWWADVARSVEPPTVEGRAVKIAITQSGLRQKIEGGRIRAKRHKNLAIPVHPDAYGLLVRSFQRETGIELALVILGDSKFFAAEVGGKFTLFYYLTPEVNQDPWPGSLPPQNQIEKAARDGAAESLLSALSEATT